jgi:hypothetical protein
MQREYLARVAAQHVRFFSVLVQNGPDCILEISFYGLNIASTRSRSCEFVSKLKRPCYHRGWIANSRDCNRAIFGLENAIPIQIAIPNVCIRSRFIYCPSVNTHNSKRKHTHRFFYVIIIYTDSKQKINTIRRVFTKQKLHSDGRNFHTSTFCK